MKNSYPTNFASSTSLKKVITFTIYISLILFAAIVSFAQNVNIPDENFKAYLIGNSEINTDENGEISIAEAEAFTGTITCSSLGISDLTGIEAFTNLTELVCRTNNLTSLDLRANVALERLDVDQNNTLSELNLTGNPALTFLNCAVNNLSILDLSANTLLTELYCQSNNLSKLDLSNNLLLTRLYVNSNQISNLDLRAHLDLVQLSVTSNLISYLDLSNNANLNRLYALSNQLVGLNVANGNNAAMSESNFRLNGNLLTCIQVDDASYSAANWTFIDAGVTFSEESCTVDIPDENFKAALIAHDPVIDTDGDMEISYAEAEAVTNNIDVSDSQIEDFTGLGAFVNLKQFIGNTNPISTIDLSSNTALENLELYNMSALPTIDVSHNSKLRVLRVAGSPTITSIDLTNNPDIYYLVLTSNPALNEIIGLEALDLSFLYLFNSGFESLDVRTLTNLTQLRVSNNNLSYLDMRNGNNQNFNIVEIQGNPNLECVLVDDAAYSTAEWTNVGSATFSDTYCDPSDPVFIPDTNFKSALLANTSLNTDENDEISFAEAEAYTLSINANDLGIDDLTGLEAFHNIFSLSVKDNNLTAIDLTGNTALVQVILTGNQLTELDLSNNVNLTSVTATSNQLTSIDVSQLPLLEKLWVKDNQLTELITTNNPELRDIECGENQIGSLDLSNNTKLETIQTHENNLMALDVSNNPELFRITAFYNDLTSIDLSNNPLLTSVNFEYNQLTSIDVSMLPILVSFKVRGNGENFVSANLQNGNNANFTGSVLLDQNPNLQCIQVDDVAYSQANWNFVDEQSGFSTDCDVVAFLDANFEDALIENTSINTNEDSFLQISEAEAITGSIDISNNNITDLTGIEAFANLTELIVSANNIASVDLSDNTKLINFFAVGGDFTTLNFTNNPDLVRVNLNNNTNLTSIDVSANSKLEFLALTNANLSSINLSANTLLTDLSVSQNNLVDLDLTGLVNLGEFYARDNQIQSLDLSGLPSLTRINIKNNDLSELNVANGNNSTLPTDRFDATGNPNLTCVTVDDVAYAMANWTNIDGQTNFSTDCSNGDTEIISFSLPEQTTAATIDNVNHTVQLEVLTGTSLTNLTPTVVISDGASISPEGPQDFTNAVTYTVTAENFEVQEWIVTATEAPAPLSLEKIAINIYPNPAANVVHVEASSVIEAEMIDLQGRSLDIKNGHQIEFNIESMQPGIYLLRVRSDDRTSMHRIIKRN